MNDPSQKDKDDYRVALLDCDKSSVEEYDKAVMTLSGAAIGISFTLMKYFGAPDNLRSMGLLLLAWTLWGLSIVFVLASHYCSHRAMRKALADLDAGKLNFDAPGGGWDTAINLLNPFGGGLFIIGLLCFLLFVYGNSSASKNHHQSSVAKTVVTTTTTTTTTTPSDDADD